MAKNKKVAHSSAAKKEVAPKATVAAQNDVQEVSLVEACACNNECDLFKPTVEQFKQSIVNHLRRTIGTSEKKASPLAWWQAVVYAVNELVFERLTQTQATHASNDTRAVNYLSAEFLMGRLTVNNLCNLEVYNTCKDALASLGIDVDVDT